MSGIPGWDRGPDESPSAGCGGLIFAAIVALILIAGLVAAGIYATNVIDAGWQGK